MMKHSKKFISIFLSLIISFSAVFAVGYSQAFVTNQKANALAPSSPYKFRNFIVKKYKNITVDDVKVDLYKKLSDGNRLVIYRLKGRAYPSVLCMCCIDKYYYEYGYDNEARIFDGKKLTSIKKAFESGKINKKILSEIDGYLKDMRVNAISVKAGREIYPNGFLPPYYKSVKSSNKKVVKIPDGKEKPPVALKKGTAVITASNKKGIKIKCLVTVTSNPKLSKDKITVKRNQTARVKIIGKAPNVKNKYKNTKYAEIISKSSSKTIKVKGLKKGNTIIKITVNGKKLSLKVKIK